MVILSLLKTVLRRRRDALCASGGFWVLSVAARQQHSPYIPLFGPQRTPFKTWQTFSRVIGKIEPIRAREVAIFSFRGTEITRYCVISGPRAGSPGAKGARMASQDLHIREFLKEQATCAGSL